MVTGRSTKKGLTAGGPTKDELAVFHDYAPKCLRNAHSRSLSIAPLSQREGWPLGMFHAVRKGRKPGVYLRWVQAKRQVTRFSGGMLRSFLSLDDAQRWSGRTLDFKRDLPKRRQTIHPLLAIQCLDATHAARALEVRRTLEWLNWTREDYDPPTNWDDAKEPLHGWPREYPWPFEGQNEDDYGAYQGPKVIQQPTTSDADTEPELSPQQARVLDAVLQGSSCFFTGSAGTGKSVLLRAVIRALRDRMGERYLPIIKAFGVDVGAHAELLAEMIKTDTSLAICASTGIAALNIGGRTLHSWAGIGVGEAEKELLLGKVYSFKDTVDRWRQVETLIIDEVSMINGHLLDKLDWIGQQIRHNQKPFGGIQVILCGDFFQLPPVDKMKTDRPPEEHIPAIYAFEAKCWPKLIRDENRYNLTRVYRQRDETFVDILEAMRKGVCDNRHQAALSVCDRKLHFDDGIDPVELYPTRLEVWEENTRQMAALQTPKVRYLCADVPGIDNNGKNMTDMAKVTGLLDEHTPLEQVVDLKVGATVMLVKNRGGSSPLVNGSMGRVVDFMTEAQAAVAGVASYCDVGDPNLVWPVVSFVPARLCSQQQYELTLVGPQSIGYENKHMLPMATRVQVPLILAWAMTIHKSQGQTLDRLKVDLLRAFTCGQAYVAISRATSMQGLEIHNFCEGAVMASEKVLQWSAEFEKQQENAREIDEQSVKGIKVEMDVDDQA